MSAFSDWNGPSNGGSSLPQVKTLEGLLVQLSTLSNQISAIGTALEAHESHVLTGLHGPIQEDYATKINALRNEIGTIASAVGPIKAALDAAKEYVDGKLGTLTQGTVAATIKAEETRAKTIEAELTAEIESEVAERIASVKVATDAIDAMLTEFTTDWLKVKKISNPTGTLIIDSDIQALDMLIGRLKVAEVVDFTKWADVNAQAVPDGETTNNVVLLLGCLSTEYDSRENGVPGIAQKHKPARVYIKFINSRPWNAIVDLVATVDSSNNSEGSMQRTGSIFAQCAKTASRDKPIQFGIYYGTNKSGEHRIYLGVVVDEALAYVSGNYVSGLNFKVVGENFIPFTNDTQATLWVNGAVSRVAIATAYDSETFAVNGISAEEIWSDNYKDAEGLPVLTTNRDNNTLELGKDDDPRQLRMHSTDRPSIVHNDDSEHKVAYLTDLAQSVYFQRDVVLIEENLAAINALQVKVQNNIILPWNTDETEYDLVPGFYTSDPYIATPSAHLFNVNDFALLKDGGSTQNTIADGKYNGILDPTKTVEEDVPLSTVTDVDIDHVKLGDPTTNTVDGTIVRDNEGKYGKIVNVNTVSNTCDIRYLNGVTTFFTYTLPQYATYNGTTFALEGNPINVPGTFDGWVHDIVYEWSGFHSAITRVPDGAETQHFYVNSYLTWMAHHENHQTMQYDNNLDQWAYTDLPFEGYRNADAQDVIDDALQELASMQPDYAADNELVNFQRPEKKSLKIPNPAYIHHKPWTGVAVLDGGDFTAPSDYVGWFADGGDFTGAAGFPSTMPAVPANKSFKNVIMRLWRGAYTDMPDGEGAAAGIKQTYANTLRWCTLNNESADEVLAFSNGTKMYHFAPIESFLHEVDGTSVAPYPLVTNLVVQTNYLMEGEHNSYQYMLLATTYDPTNGASAPQMFRATVNSDTRPIGKYVHLTNIDVSDIAWSTVLDGRSTETNVVSIVTQGSPRLTLLEEEVDAEITRAMIAESALDTKVEAEIVRATDAESALDTKIETETTRATAAETALSDRTTIIEGVIPADATTTNKLVSSDDVDQRILAQAARAITFNAAGDPYPERPVNDLMADGTPAPYYYQGEVTTPTDNDYIVVSPDALYDGGTVRYGRAGIAWVFRYKVNDAPFTPEQMAAINSGATFEKINSIATLAPLANPMFSGVPRGPTPSVAPPDASDAFATTEFVKMRQIGLLDRAGLNTLVPQGMPYTVDDILQFYRDNLKWLFENQGGSAEDYTSDEQLLNQRWRFGNTNYPIYRKTIPVNLITLPADGTDIILGSVNSILPGATAIIACKGLQDPRYPGQHTANGIDLYIYDDGSNNNTLRAINSSKIGFGVTAYGAVILVVDYIKEAIQ